MCDLVPHMPGYLCVRVLSIQLRSELILYLGSVLGKSQIFKIMDSNLEVCWPQCFAFLFILKVVKETGSAKAKHLGIKQVWMGRVESALYIHLALGSNNNPLDWYVQP